MLDELKRIALFSSGVAELTRYRAEQIVKDLVKVGDVRREQASSLVRDLLETSRSSRQELLKFVRAEIQNQIGGLGLANQRELDRLERRVARLEAERKAGKKSIPAKSEPRAVSKRATSAKVSKASGSRTGASKATTAKTGRSTGPGAPSIASAVADAEAKPSKSPGSTQP